MTEASPGKLNRQQLYDRIRETSKEEYILSEMKRLGFWPNDNNKPSAAEQSINRQTELQTELRQLLKRQRQIEDPETALREMRKKRLKESRDRQEQNRIDKNQQRYEKASAWHEKQKTEITYLGETVSAGLSDNQSDEDKLGVKGLPLLHTADQLANAMGISIGELRFLSYSRDVSTVSHYKYFNIRKKSGGERCISAPMPRLKIAQYWILENVLQKIPLHNASHGFAKGRSIVTNAAPHVGQALVVNMDLQDFFPTLSYRRVKGLIKSFGYSEQIATILGLLLTEPQCDEVELHDQQFFVARGERRLPQGSPASPAVSNVTCRGLDHRLDGMATKLGFAYTRYADDMTFSAADASAANSLNKLMWRARSIVVDEGFIVHPDKTRIMRQGSKQEVTGLVVNEKPGIDRKKIRRFRAALNRLEKGGWDAVTWESSDNTRDSMMGFANYVCMVDPAKGNQLRDRLRAAGQYSPQSFAQSKYSNGKLRAAARDGVSPDWWQPAERVAPALEKTRMQVQEEQRAVLRARRSSESEQTSSENSARQSVEQSVEQSVDQSGGSLDEHPQIDPATGRFRPAVGRLFTVFALFLAAAVITRMPLLLVAGVGWVALSYYLWRQPLLYRVAALLIGLPLIMLLLRLIFRLF